MKITKRFGALFAFVFLFPLCRTLLIVLPMSATAQDEEYVVAELGGVKVVSIPQPSPARGLLATKVVLRTKTENKLVTFENVKITGAVHHVWIPSFNIPGPTPIVDAPLWNVLPPEWAAADSHILISPSMVAGEAGGGHGGISEIVDASSVIDFSDDRLPLLGGQAPAVTAISDLGMIEPTDAFFLRTDLQTHEIELARVVTPEAGAEGAAGEVFLTVGVLGDGIINSGQPNGASFGFNGNEPVAIFSLVPEPATGLMAGMAFLALLGLRRRLLVVEDVS